jgi:hypothetical protein
MKERPLLRLDGFECRIRSKLRSSDEVRAFHGWSPVRLGASTDQLIIVEKLWSDVPESSALGISRQFHFRDGYTEFKRHTMMQHVLVYITYS